MWEEKKVVPQTFCRPGLVEECEEKSEVEKNVKQLRENGDDAFAEDVDEGAAGILLLRPCVEGFESVQCPGEVLRVAQLELQTLHAFKLVLHVKFILESRENENMLAYRPLLDCQ